MALEQSAVLTVGTLVPKEGVHTLCFITPCLSFPLGVESHRSSLAPEGHYIRAVSMRQMVNRAHTRLVAANLIGGHLAHAVNHTHGTAGHSQGTCSAPKAVVWAKAMAFGQGAVVMGGYRSCPAMQCGATVTTALTYSRRPICTKVLTAPDYGEVNKKTKNHSVSIPNMEHTLERIAKCRYKTKMDKRSGFWQVDLTAAVQELLAFITPKGRVFKWKLMPVGVANTPALLGELMNKLLYILRRRPLVQELISRGAEMEIHIDDVSLGTNTEEDHVLLLRELFIVCQENHFRIKLEKCEFMKGEMEHLGFDVRYGWWKYAAPTGHADS